VLLLPLLVENRLLLFEPGGGDWRLARHVVALTTMPGLMLGAKVLDLHTRATFHLSVMSWSRDNCVCSGQHVCSATDANECVQAAVVGNGGVTPSRGKRRPHEWVN
jgi:hypothetical protein